MRQPTILGVIALVVAFVVFFSGLNYLVKSGILFFCSQAATILILADYKKNRIVYGIVLAFWLLVAFYGIGVAKPNLEQGLRINFSSDTVNAIQSWEGLFVIAIIAAISATVTYFYYAQNKDTAVQPSLAIPQPSPVEAPSVSRNTTSPQNNALEAELQKLADLKSKGLIDEEEFKALKKKLLDSM